MNIVLLVADSLRADHLTCYGYPRLTSPFIAGLAEEGCLFTHCFAASTATDPCFTTIHTGQYPITHGIIGMYGPERNDRWLADDAPVLAEALAGQGYVTAAVDSLQKWHKRGFERYLVPESGEKKVPIAGCVFTGDVVNRAALAWAERYRPGRPYFLFVHYWDTHAPYEPPVAFSRLFESDELWDMPLPRKVFLDILRACTYTEGELREQIANYDREIAHNDRLAQDLVEALGKRGMLEDTLIIFTADHGESLWEKDCMLQHYNLHDPVVHVPLLMWAPGRLPEGRQVGGLCSQVDIMPTILALAGIPCPAGVEGESLLPAIARGKTGRKAVWLEEGTHQRTRAVRTDCWKFVKSIKPAYTRAPARELYDLRRDPGETHNLWPRRRRLATRLERMLSDWVNAHGVDYDGEETAPWQCLYGPFRDKTF